MRHVGLLVSLVVGVLLAEGILSLAIHTIPEVDLLFGGRIPRWFEDERLSLRPNERHPDHDARGFRNARAVRRADVVVLGDSTSYGSGVGRQEAWPNQSSKLVGADMYNMAFPGWGPGQALLVLDEALDLEPRLLVEAVYPGNDLRDLFHLVYGLGQLPELRSTDSDYVEELRATERRDPIRQRASELARVSLAPVPEGEAPSGAVSQLRSFLERRSRIYQLLGILKRRVSKVSSTADWSSLRARCQDSAYCEAFETDQSRTLFTPEYRRIALDDEDLRVTEGKRILLEALVRLRDRARDAGVGLLVLWIPTKESVFAPQVEEEGGLSASFDSVVTEEESLRLETLRWLADEGIPVVDALPLLRASLLEGSSPYRESTDGHPNPLGHRLIAEGLAPRVEEMLSGANF